MPNHHFTYLASGVSTSNVASYTTNSFTPTENCLLIGFVSNTDTVLPDPPTLAGNRLNWVNRGTVLFNTTATPLSRLSVFSAVSTGVVTTSPATGSFASNQTACFIGIGQFSETHLSGNGASGIYQIVSGRADATENPSINLTGLSTNSSVIACFTNDTNPFGATPEDGWQGISDMGVGGPNNGNAIYLRLTTTDNTVSVTRAASDWGGFALEIGWTGIIPESSFIEPQRRIFIIV